jgi:hypothetical protein
MMLAGAGLVGTASVAHAQPAPEPGQPTPPPGQPAPPPADFGVAPAALPSAPVGSATPLPTVSWGNQPPATDTATPAPEKKGNPIFFTRFNWTNTASTQMFGIGPSYQGSEGQRYDMDFALNLRYYFINESVNKFWVNAAITVTTELTNSDTTTLKHEPLLRDIPVGVGFSRAVYKNADKSIVTTPAITASYALPVSKTSIGSGRYGALGVNGILTQTFPIASKSDWFSDIFILGLAGWSHFFTKGTTPVNSIIPSIRPRQGGIGGVKEGGIDTSAIEQDQLSGAFLAHDAVRLNLTYYLTIYKDLSFGNSWEVSFPFKYTGSATCVQTSTGCAPVPESNMGSRNYATTFDVGFSYVLFNTARIDLGYQNSTVALDDNMGKRRNIFYGPDSAFYTNVSIYIDAILDKTLNLSGQATKSRSAQRFAPGSL